MSEKTTSDELVQKIRALEKEAFRCREVEQALRTKEAQYQRIFNSATDSLLIFDRRGRIVEANPQACKMYGYSYEELTMLSREDIVHPEYHFLFEQFRKDTKDSGHFASESKDIKKDGSPFFVEVRGTEFEYNGRRHVLVIVRDVTERRQADEALRNALSQIEQLKERLESENVYLREEIDLRSQHEEIIGQSQAIIKSISQAERVAETDSIVLIMGETGTGKELLARAIHRLSRRKNKPMVKVNCAALSPNLIESEFFGHEKGAFTGAFTKQVGRFEVAHDSTVFLDEISELSPALQAKLLRVIQEGDFERLGSTQTIHVNVRIIAATNRDLAAAVAEKTFRLDLYYRLNVFPIVVPPLRDRREDIPLLVWSFVREFEKSMGKRIETIPRKSMDELQRYPWPGNVRELRNVIERAMILSSGNVLQVALPDLKSPDCPEGVLPLQELERRHIRDVLEKTGWRVRRTRGAAALLKINPSTLDSKIRKLKIRRWPDAS
jgi:formate hydrogenlyase transcriptional activator